MTNADKILARLEKLRGAWAIMLDTDYFDEHPVERRELRLRVADLDAAIADVKAMLQSRQTVPVRVDDRWRALLAEMRSYNDFEARCADRIESLLAEPEGFCHAQLDGDCNWTAGCPQIRDGEPRKTGRSCPLPHYTDSPEY